MAKGELSSRALPRVFIPGATADEPVDLPREELEKFRKVLRLGPGDLIAVLPGDGSLIRCELQGRQAVPLRVEWPKTESDLDLTIAQALPKGDKLETVVRMCTEMGVGGFVLFPSERSVVKWEPSKLQDRLRRYAAVAQEATEQSFRVRLPRLEVAASLAEVLKRHPDSTVLSEAESVNRRLSVTGPQMTVVVGPEGGWSPRELTLIGERGVTLGPRVLRADTAGPAAAAILLLGNAPPGDRAGTL
ncbi:MAG TPA: RsmE family RNA methyltransferase [Fimbriimonadaceae bacterium]|nr:RsmE family RNA methyltransferase [Fimbriimonadaceae bacterium]